MTKLRVTLTTGRTLAQGATREGMKTLNEYVRAAAVCELDPGDMEKLGVKEGDLVRVTTKHGSVIVRATISTQAPHPSIVFMPIGPWANVLIGAETDSIGMPSFKSISAEVEPAPGETIQDAISFLRRKAKSVIREF